MTRTSFLLPRLFPVLACLAALALSVAPPWQAASAVSAASTSATPDLINRVVDLTNAERQKFGLAPLVPNSSLTVAAQDYARVLSAGDCFAHTCGPVPEFSTRAASAGYSGWIALAENIAAGQPTPEAVVAAWMASPGHRANILNPAYTEIGAGTATGGRYGMYWAQEFGSRRTQPASAPLPTSPAQPASAPAFAPTPAPPAGSPMSVGTDTTPLEQQVLDLASPAPANSDEPPAGDDLAT